MGEHPMVTVKWFMLVCAVATPLGLYAPFNGKQSAAERQRQEAEAEQKRQDDRRRCDDMLGRELVKYLDDTEELENEFNRFIKSRSPEHIGRILTQEKAIGPLHCAISGRQGKAIRKLREWGARFAVDEQGRTPLHLLLGGMWKDKDLTFVHAVLGEFTEFTLDPQTLNVPDNQKRTPFFNFLASYCPVTPPHVAHYAQHDADDVYLLTQRLIYVGARYGEKTTAGVSCLAIAYKAYAAALADNTQPDKKKRPGVRIWDALCQYAIKQEMADDLTMLTDMHRVMPAAPIPAPIQVTPAQPSSAFKVSSVLPVGIQR